MIISPDDAKTDVILAGAAALFGGVLRGILGQIPGYPRTGTVALLVDLAWIFAVTGLVPLLLARHRGDRAAAFGLSGRPHQLRMGLSLAALVVAGELAGALMRGLPTGSWASGRLAAILVSPAPPSVALAVVGQLVLLTLGAVLLLTFVVRRSADAFPRSAPVPLIQFTRTAGICAAAVALFAGGLRVLVGGSFVATVLDVVVLVAMVLVVGRPGVATGAASRASLFAPLVLVGILHLFATGGLLRGDLLGALHAGGLAVGITTVITTLVRTRSHAWTVVPLLIALHWWPSCLSPLAIEIARAC